MTSRNSIRVTANCSVNCKNCQPNLPVFDWWNRASRIHAFVTKGWLSRPQTG